MTKAEFGSLYERLRAEPPWGPADRRGALNYLTPVTMLAAGGFNQTSWLPVRSWTYAGGDYVIAVDGDLFVIGERAKLGSLDELNRLLRAGHQ
jgi:roadblock/LC7 domain-containing protein